MPILLQSIYSIPSCAGIFLAYMIPGYLLAGIHYPQPPHLNHFYSYLGNNQFLTIICPFHGSDRSDRSFFSKRAN